MENAKIPGLLTFFRHVEMVIIDTQKPRSVTLMKTPDTVCRDGNLGVFGGGTRLAMPKTRLRAGLIVIEAWFRGY